jgi:DNA polymerase I-like protein with 3'-5' exonuclease and polymerase domains
MGFEFGAINTTTKRKEISIDQKNPVIYIETKKSNDYQICILLDTFYPKSIMDSFIKWVQINTSNNFIVLVATTLDCKAEELKQVVDFYTRNTINLKEYLPNTFNNIYYISVGRAIYSFTESDDLTVESFYDFIFNKTYFFSPKVNSYVFPIDYLTLLFKKFGSSMVIKNSARVNFASLQIQYLKNEAKVWDKKIPEFTIHTLLTKEDINAYLNSIMKYTGKIAIDTETSSLDFNTCELGCITVCSDRKNTYFLNFKEVDKDLFNNCMSNKQIIGQNYKFDFKVLKKNGIITPLPISDTMILGQTLNEMRGNSLKALSYLYTKFGGYENELEQIKKKYRVTNYLNIPFPVLSKYASMDALVTFIAEEEMQKQIDLIDISFDTFEDGYTVRKYYENLIMPAFREFMDIEYTGMYVDEKRCDEVSKEIINSIQSIKIEIFKELNVPVDTFDLTSPKQLGKFIEYKLGWQDYGRNKDNSYATGEEQLVRWVKDGHKVAKMIKEFRSLSTILGMFVGTPNTKEGWREYFVKHPDGSTRIHPSFGVGMADSKRNTCQNPNLQQVPSHGIFSDEIKSVITVPPPDADGDYVFGTLDYASLQIRLCALDSMDSFLCHLYKTEADPDLHSTTAYELVKDTAFNFIKVNQEGKIYEFFELETIKINRGGKLIEIIAKDLKEMDILLDFGTQSQAQCSLDAGLDWPK